MKVLALISGGKDSCYSMLQCIAAGHEVVALAHLYPPLGIDELDSFMYQSVGYNLIPMYAEAVGLPLFQREIRGKSCLQSKDYHPTEGDEVEDLYEVIRSAKESVEFDAVASGAIFSDYQRIRVESICARLGLVSLAYLWQREQEELLQEMLDAGIRAIIIKVACLGLEPEKHLGRELSQIQSHLKLMNEKFGINVCGEGGEYETFTLDCPLFKSSIELDAIEKVIHSADAFAPVAFIKMLKAHLSEKSEENAKELLRDRLANVKIKRPIDFLESSDYSKRPDGELSSRTDSSNEVPSFKLNLNVTTSEDKDGKFEIKGLIGNSSTMKASVQSVMEEVTNILGKNEMSLENLTLVNIFLNNMGDYGEFNTEYVKYFNINPPARACVETKMNGGAHFYMNCKAARQEKKSLHVQSISHWAPANIGPYSQAVQTDEWIYSAGQIALIPGSMELLKGDEFAQSHLIFRHLSRILDAVYSGCDLRNIVTGLCYLNSHLSEATAIKESLTLFAQKEMLLSVVVVDGLPRNAGVEWQVVAHLDPKQWQFSSDVINRDANTVCLETAAGDEKTFAKIALKTSSKADREEISEILKLAFQNACNGASVTDVTAYASREASENVQFFYDVLLSCHLDASISMIPVKNIEDDCSLLLMLEANVTETQ